MTEVEELRERVADLETELVELEDAETERDDALAEAGALRDHGAPLPADVALALCRAGIVDYGTACDMSTQGLFDFLEVVLAPWVERLLRAERELGGPGRL